MSERFRQQHSMLTISAASENHFLRQGNVLSVGRSGKNDIVLTHPTVSRIHALFRWDSAYPLIQDRNSTSGVCVDGEYVSYKHLYGVHTIKLGSVFIKTKLSIEPLPTTSSNKSCDSKIELHDSNAVLEALSDSDEVTLFGEKGSKDIIGYLADNQALRKLLVHLELSRRTGTLSITESSITGIIKYGLGKIRSAQCGKRRNLAALQKICTFSGGSYHFTINVDVGEAKLCISPMCYLRTLSQRLTKKVHRNSSAASFLINSHDLDDLDDY